MKFLAAKSFYLYYYLKKKMLLDQDMWCREENFIVLYTWCDRSCHHGVDFEIPEIKTMHTFTFVSFFGWLCMWP